MRPYLLIISISLLPFFSIAQKPNGNSREVQSKAGFGFNSKTRIISFGLGVPNLYRINYDEPPGYAHVKTTGFGPIYAKFEIAATGNIGIVPAFGYSTFHYSYQDPLRIIYYDDVNTINLSLSGNYHFKKLFSNPRVDFYAGLGIAMNYLRSLYGNIPPYKQPESKTYFKPCGRIGMRYYIDPIFGLYAEGGYDGLSILQLGLSVKF